MMRWCVGLALLALAACGADGEPITPQASLETAVSLVEQV